MAENTGQSTLTPNKSTDAVIQVSNVKKVYRMGSERILAVDGVSFDIKKGEFCCLLGTSGSGKSTLLNLMAGIEKCTSGSIVIKGKNIRKMSEKNLAKFRQRYLGFVFQSYNLINSMTALENVELPLVFKRIKPKQRKKLAKEMLVKVGLGKRLAHKPKEMSGGQQQRVGIARAFVAKPEIVFADEPTGNLDTKTTMEVMKLIKQISRDNHQTIVMVTHDPRLAAFADKIIHILDGKIQNIELCEHRGEVTLQLEEESAVSREQKVPEPIEMNANMVVEEQAQTGDLNHIQNTAEEVTDKIHKESTKKVESPKSNEVTDKEHDQKTIDKVHEEKTTDKVHEENREKIKRKDSNGDTDKTVESIKKKDGERKKPFHNNVVSEKGNEV